MPYSEEEFKFEIDGIIFEIEAAKKNIQDFNKRHYNGIREKAVIFCLQRSYEIAQGVIALARTNYLAAIKLLDRGIFECFIWIRWITISIENAQYFHDIGENEIRRIMRKNLAKGHGKIVDKIIKTDKTKEFLTSETMKDIPKRKSLEDIAKEASLEKLYTMFYGPMSVEAHGVNFGLSDFTNDDDNRFISLASINSFLECINLIAKNWIEKRKQIENSEIDKVLD